MALYPRARVRLLPESGTQRRIVPAIIIDHTQAGTGSLYNYWLSGTGLECHFWVARSGLVEQYMDTVTQSDANLDANGWREGSTLYGAISIETENSREATNAAYRGGEGAAAFDRDPWTPEQLAALKALHDWLATTHPTIKRQRANAPTVGGRGLGYHSMWGTGPTPWIPYSSRGKTCPGKTRIAQWNEHLLPAFTATIKGPPLVAFPGRLIRPGDVSADVGKWSFILRGLGYRGFLMGQSATSYGAGKVAATKRFQRRYGLNADGVVGPVTWAKANDIIAARRAAKR